MRTVLLRLVFAGLLAVPMASQAGFVGQEFTASYRYPDASTPYALSSFSPSTFTVGVGLDTTGDVEGVTSLLVDFGDTSLTITLQTVLTNPTWASSAFNGPAFAATLPTGITSATVDAGATTLVGFDNSRVSFDTDEIFVNWQGLSHMDGNVVRIDFGFAAVPEPGSLALAFLALSLAGVALRRRTTA